MCNLPSLTTRSSQKVRDLNFQEKHYTLTANSAQINKEDTIDRKIRASLK